MDFIEYFKERPCNKCECYTTCPAPYNDDENKNITMIFNRLESIMIDGCGDCFIEVKHYVD